VARWRRVVREEFAPVRRRMSSQAPRLDAPAGRRGNLRGRVDKQARATQKLRGRLERQSRRIDRLQASITEIRETLAPTLHGQRQREVDYLRAMQQLGALETRIGRIEEKLESDDLTSDDASLNEARSLVDTVRREHDQARVRFQIIAAYEERMRRLEAAIIDMYDGDVRHPI